MTSLKGVDIKRGKLGASVIDNEDGICGLLATGVALEGSNSYPGLALNTTVKLRSLADLEALGITEDYDTANTCAVYRHVSEYFRMAGDGSTLYLMLYSGTQESAFAASGPARQIIADSNGEIRVLAVANTPAAPVEDEEDPPAPFSIGTLAAAAQGFYDWTFETFRPCQVVLEYNGFAALTAASADDLKELEVNSAALDAYKVSVCVGQDYQYADQFSDSRRTMADVGTMLGCIAAKAVNENIAEVATGNLTDAVKGKWTVAGLSNHKKISEWDSQLETLDDKGYIFAIAYAGLAGFYWNNDYTCTKAVKDENGYLNECTISYGRVLDKCVRGLRKALLPYVKSNQPVDPQTGKLPQALLTNFEAIADNAVFRPMEANGEISGGKTTVDANSDLLTTPRVLTVSFVVVPMGQIDEIKGTINLKTSL